MSKPLISIILPIYNIEKYLDKCINSVLKQTYQHIEIILVNDGSTDHCPQICDKYKSIDRRIVVLHKTNGGLSDARNFGIKASNGLYITCIDPDDYVDFDYVEYLYDLIIKYKTKMSICQSKVHYANGSIKERGGLGDEVIDAKMCLERMLYHDVIDTSAWGKLYHRDLFNEVEYPKGKLFEDIGTTYKLIMQCDSIAVGYESKYHYIIRNNSIVTGAFTPSKFDLLEMTDEMASNVNISFPDLEKATLRRRVYARLSTINQMLYTTNYESMRHDMIKFVKQNRTDILKNAKAPLRDKIAIILLSISYSLYKLCWIGYQKAFCE